MASTDRDSAFREINGIFNASENEDKSNTWKCEQLRIVLFALSKDAYYEGVKRGIDESQKTIHENRTILLEGIKTGKI